VLLSYTRIDKANSISSQMQSKHSQSTSFRVYHNCANILNIYNVFKNSESPPFQDNINQQIEKRFLLLRRGYDFPFKASVTNCLWKYLCFISV